MSDFIDKLKEIGSKILGMGIIAFLAFIFIAGFVYTNWNQIRWNLEGRPHTIYLEPGDRIWHVYYPLWIQDWERSTVAPFPDDLVEHSRGYTVYDFWTPFRDYFPEDLRDLKEAALFTSPRFLFLKDPDDQWHQVNVKYSAEKFRWLHY